MLLLLFFGCLRVDTVFVVVVVVGCLRVNTVVVVNKAVAGT